MEELIRKEELPKQIQVMESEGVKTVLLRGQHYMSWSDEDQISPRIAIAQLHKIGFFSREELADAFGVHANTISNYISSFDEDGVEGLLDRQRGPKQRWKLVPGLKAEILRAALLEGITTYEGIQKRLGMKEQKVSAESIRQVLIENGFVKEKIEVDENRQADFFEYFCKRDDRQLELPLILGEV